MSNVKTAVKIEGRVFVELTEGEARALEAIVGYGPDQFVKWFYKNLGTCYLKPHENHTRSLFHTLREGSGEGHSTWNKISSGIKCIVLGNIYEHPHLLTQQ